MVTKIMSDLKDIPGPKILHVLTQKGKGYQAPDSSQDGEGDLKSYEKMIKKKFRAIDF